VDPTGYDTGGAEGPIRIWPVYLKSILALYIARLAAPFSLCVSPFWEKILFEHEQHVSLLVAYNEDSEAKKAKSGLDFLWCVSSDGSHLGKKDALCHSIIFSYSGLSSTFSTLAMVSDR
jgi:hypothetical protein